MSKIISLIFFLMWCYTVELVKVKVEEGWLEGQKLVPITGDGVYYSFKGIPYAAPPVGNLRFKAPQPPLKWKGTRNASEHGSKCIQQYSVTDKTVVGDENCLFLNVYSPNVATDSPMPVMMFIHGGGFFTDSGNDDKYSPDFLMSFGVVLVTINFRLGPFGFLAAGTKDVPGNAGLKDQVAAMKWIQRNIRKFGGDPDSVTIFGESSGGASVSLHVISPAAKGLFHRAIIMSGVLFSDWCTTYDPESRAFTLGRLLGLNTKDPIELVNFLQSLPPEKLLPVHPNTLLSDEVAADLFLINYYTPVVEKNNYNGDEQYLTECPISLMSKGKINQVDHLIGHNAMEGTLDTFLVEKNILKYFPTYKQLLVPRKISYFTSLEKVLKFADQILNFYFGTESISFNTMKNFANFYAYFQYLYDIYLYIEKLPKSSKTRRFFYELLIYSSRNVYAKLGAKRYGIEQATHRDDLPYLFHGSFYNLTVDINSDAYKYVQLTCTLFTNFAKYGTPTPDDSLGLIWPEYDPDRSVVVIGETGQLTATTISPNTNSSIEFWRKLYLSAGINKYVVNWDT